MTIEIDKIDAVFNSASEEDDVVAILVQPNPDPDCLGAAAGFGLLLQNRYNLKSKIFHMGDVSHPQNKSMINILHLKLSKGELFNSEDYSFTVVLDTDLTNTGFKTDTFKSAKIRIDHHSMSRDNGGSIEDIRVVGSTCSIVWDWLRKFEIDLENHSDVCTALILGIKTDTADFSSNTTAELDFEAFRDLIPHVDKERLAKLTAYTLPISLFENESRAFNQKDVRTSVLVSNVGTLIPQKRDDIPIIADNFVRMDGISTAIILGIVDNHLIASVRSKDSRVNVENLCEEVFGTDFSGAKEGCGGARVPLKPFEPIEGMEISEELRSKLEDELFKFYSEKIFGTLGE